LLNTVSFDMVSTSIERHRVVFPIYPVEDFEGICRFSEDALGVLLLPPGVETMGFAEQGAADRVAEVLAGEGSGADGRIQGGESLGDLVPDETGDHIGAVFVRCSIHFCPRNSRKPRNWKRG